MAAKDYYQVLGVPEDADAEAIKKKLEEAGAAAEIK